MKAAPPWIQRADCPPVLPYTTSILSEGQRLNLDSREEIVMNTTITNTTIIIIGPMMD
jgi:hypothetical protein